MEQHHGKTRDRIIIEKDLLRAGIKANPGPTGEMTVKMPCYEKYTRSLSQCLLTYVKRCETKLNCRVQRLFSFVDPIAETTACISPIVTSIMSMEAAELKDTFYANQEVVTVEMIESELDDYKCHSVGFQ